MKTYIKIKSNSNKYYNSTYIILKQHWLLYYCSNLKHDLCEIMISCYLLELISYNFGWALDRQAAPCIVIGWHTAIYLNKRAWLGGVIAGAGLTG